MLFCLQLITSEGFFPTSQRVSGGTITQGQGSVQFEATFRLAVFRPFSGEILIARLCKSTP